MTTFPTSLDSLTNPVAGDTLNSPSHAGQHTDANDAIEALEAKVGIDGSLDTDSLDYKVAALQTSKQDTLTGLTASVAELNQLDGNNGITASNLATNAILLGYTSKTSDFTTSSGTPTQVTGLTSSVTIPAGGRSVKITSTGRVQNSNGSAYTTMSIWDGTVGSGTQLQSNTEYFNTANTPHSITCIAVHTPAAGAKTYNIALDNAGGGGTALLGGGATAPSFILVELI